MIYPPFLQKGSKIALVAPSGAVEAAYIETACQTLQNWGLQVVLGAHVMGKYHRFAGTDAERIADLQAAIDAPDVAAILCARGGYGLARIVDKINFTPLLTRPKWLIGFSDITALHGALSAVGVASVHGIMAKHIGLPSEPTEALRNLLFGQLPTYHVAPHPLNRSGEAHGRLIGGNLSVLYGLRATPFDIQASGHILLIEDLCEPMYHIDRMIQNLRLSGVLEQISGLIVGQFSDIAPDTSFAQGVYGLIADAVKDYTYPVCMDAPVGHVEANFPLVIGGHTTLTVTSQKAIVKQL
jgi:muramoyltetrapeptide carboxypeptidase